MSAGRPSRTWWIIVALVVAALIATFPGFHLLARGMPRLPAMLISHGIGLLLLGAAAWRWWGPRGAR